MKENLFITVAASENNSKWSKLIQREDTLYSRKNDIRTEFGRDYTRILHCLAYRRLKHKTQVFFDTCNDHICTRIEHVNHVESVSYTIAKYLGLNVELTKAISVSHDLGHAPFGHQGEKVIEDLYKKYLDKNFWHEQNGLRFVDKIELLEDDNRKFKNLNLTYAVRDGIISHCGEIDENCLFPRIEPINLDDFSEKGLYQPFTWEACVVKIADKISYLGRDIEDALRLKFINFNDLWRLGKIARKFDHNTLNTTTIMHNLITDLCENSSPERGLSFSGNNLEMLNEVKQYNYDVIYNNDMLDDYKEYSRLVLNSIFDTLLSLYEKGKTLNNLNIMKKRYYGLTRGFSTWLIQYCSGDILNNGKLRNYENEKIYGMLSNRKIYIQAIIDYISGMTDQFAVKCFEELLKL